MNTFNKKNIPLVLMLALSGLLSVNASAETTPSIEHIVSDFIVTQSQEMVTEINKQLQESIQKDIAKFSLNFHFDGAATVIEQKKIANTLVTRETLTGEKEIAELAN